MQDTSPLSEKTSLSPTLGSISPFFIVDNLKTSVSFYVNKLGFKVLFIGPDEDPFFAMLGCDNVSIMLKEITPDVKPVPNHTRHEWAPWDAYIYTKEPDVLFHEYSARGVKFHKPLHTNGDNISGFEVADADEYVLFFGTPI